MHIVCQTRSRGRPPAPSRHPSERILTTCTECEELGRITRKWDGAGNGSCGVATGLSHPIGLASVQFVADTGTYDQMEIYWISGSKFAVPSFRNFSKPIWNVISDSSTHSVAAGPTTSNLQFDICFQGSSSEQLSFDFMAFNGTTIVDNARATWNGGWSFRALTDAEKAAHVPEPDLPLAIARRCDRR